MDIKTWMNDAVIKINSLDDGTEFALKDLFDGVKWEDLPKGDRLTFGRSFKNDVSEGNVKNVTYIGKAPNNSAKYRKVNN